MAQERWLTVQQIADKLQVNPETVRYWLRAGRLRGVPFGGRTGWRVTETELNRFIEEASRARIVHE